MDSCNSEDTSEGPKKQVEIEFLDPNNLIIEKHIQSQETKQDHDEESKGFIMPLKGPEKSNLKSPAQNIVEKMIPLPYKEPPWSGLPSKNYSFDVLKGGVIIESIPFNKPFLTVGRLVQCDINMQHPSISRFHCIIQFRSEGSEEEPIGVYVYDLESSHGTFQNKYRLQPNSFNRLRVGHMLKFGKSTRMFILQGPDEDQETQSAYSVTELKALAEEKKKKLEKLEYGGEDETIKINEAEKKQITAATSGTDGGINWGMSEDAVEEAGEDHVNPFAAANEDLYLDDPKKTLRGWFEREGYDLPQYEASEISPGKFSCKLDLPVEGSVEGSITCSVDHKGKKRDAVIQCALEACRILDKKGLLRQATHESHKRKKKNWSENDYYDSDEDEFLDRTGDIENKRRKRKNESESFGSEAFETYDSLKREYEVVIKEIDIIEEKLSETNRILHRGSNAEDDIDDYMDQLSSRTQDKEKILTRKVELNHLKKNEERIRKLINIARPLGIPELKPKSYISLSGDSSSSGNSTKGRVSKLKGRLKGSPGTTLPYVKSKDIAVKLKTGVHHLFLEEEDTKRSSLTKVDFDDDSFGVQAVPYDKGDRKPKHKIMYKPEKIKLTIEKPASACEEKVVVETVDITKEEPAEILHSSVPSSILLEEEIPEPTSSANEEQEPEQVESTIEFKKPSIGIKKSKKKMETNKSLFSFEKDYESWVPPQDQTGDGRTALNDKLGY